MANKLTCKSFSDILSTFEKSVECPEEFYETQNNGKAEVFRSMTKLLYDTIQKTTNDKDISSKVLPSLIIKNFDDEQIWQQLELRNEPVTAHFNKSLKSFDLNNIAFAVAKSGGKNYLSDLKSVEEDVDDDEEGSDYPYDGSDSDESEKQVPRHSESRGQETSREYTKYNPASVVDDRFFKVSELEEFLNYEDMKEERRQQDSGSDESDVDFFADIPSGDEAMDDDDDTDDVKKSKSAREIMYKDFFDPPEKLKRKSFADPEYDESADEGFEADYREPVDLHDEQQKTVRFSQNVETNKKLQLLEDSDDDRMLNENIKEVNPNAKTAFEKQQEKERKTIKELEESLLKKKPWQLTGEVAADSRPQDSLLRQEVNYDSNLKQDFVTTDEVTERVENIIKMAIANKAWCDVEVKMRPIEEHLTYKPVEPLDQSKSKKSLAEVYEDEYLKHFEDKTEKEDPHHVEIRKLMDSVASTLSTLFGHTPRPPIPEIKVVNNMPAITVEEVAPVFVSDAALLAPEEIKPKSSLPIGKSERTETDKKRERRKKKKLQKVRSLEKEEREKKKASTSEKEASKFAKQQALKKLSQQKNVTIVHEKKRVKKK